MAAPILLRPVCHLNISMRTANMLKARRIYYIGDLVYRTEIDLVQRLSISNSMVVEIKEALAARGLTFGMRVEDLPDEMGPNPILLHVVEDLEITAAIADALKSENLYYIGDLAQRTEAELLQRPDISKPMILEIRKALRRHRLDFAG